MAKHLKSLGRIGSHCQHHFRAASTRATFQLLLLCADKLLPRMPPCEHALHNPCFKTPRILRRLPMRWQVQVQKDSKHAEVEIRGDNAEKVQYCFGLHPKVTVYVLA